MRLEVTATLGLPSTSPSSSAPSDAAEAMLKPAIRVLIRAPVKETPVSPKAPIGPNHLQWGLRVLGVSAQELEVRASEGSYSEPLYFPTRSGR